MMQLSHAAPLMHGQLCGSDARFKRVSTDSRSICCGDLFVAIVGQRNNGHDFIAQAKQQGAVGALVSSASRCGIAQIKVSDTTTALGQLGAYWRSRFTIPLVAVTGSNGKTTVSALIAAILNQVGNCLSPQHSFNNQWGVPLTLLRLRKSHTHAVIEMGMSRRGEIRSLSQLAAPDIALINNVGAAHLAGFSNLRRIAMAKAEIFSGLKRSGTAVLNADDAFHRDWLLSLNTDKVLHFGLHRASPTSAVDVSADNIRVHASGSEFELNLKGQRIPVRLPLLGLHNVRNAVAASAAAYAAGAEEAHIKYALEKFTALPGRLQVVRGLNGARILDDSYNANPASSKAALEVLAELGGERIAILGSMAELGEMSDELHHQVGLHGRACGIERLVCMGPADNSSIAQYARGFGRRAKCYHDIDTLLQELTPTLTDASTVLVKGSRAAAMERVVSRLLATPPGGSSC